MKSIFGTRLKRLRNEYSLTQEELSKLLNISKSNISKYENGTIEPSFEILNKISDFFKVSLDYLLGRTNIKEPYEPVVYQENIFDNNRIIAAHHDNDEFSPEERKQIREILKLLKNQDDKLI